MVKVLIPSGALGIGFDRTALANGLLEKPDIIAIDGGSTDSGPHYLGTGTSKYARSAIKAEWSELMAARESIGVPLLIGTAGTCGADSAVDWFLDITREIAAESGGTLRVAVLKSGQDVESTVSAFKTGRVAPLEAAPEISEALIQSCTNIVALAGAEQIQSALDTGADIVIAGRTTDTAVIAALPLAKGCHPGAAWHGAKIGECGALATTNPNTGSILIEFDETGFTVTPMSLDAAATPKTVFAHMLYENSDPYLLYEPGGHLDVREAQYAALDERRVRVTNSQWVPNPDYTVKLEGARIGGYQTVSTVMIREPRYVASVREWCERISQSMQQRIESAGYEGVSIDFRIVGDNATLGRLETRQTQAHEVGVLAIVTAGDQGTANDVAKTLNPMLLHFPLSPHEPLPTFSFPFSPPENERGPIYEFCLNHVMTLDDPMSAFSLDVVEL